MLPDQTPTPNEPPQAPAEPVATPLTPQQPTEPLPPAEPTPPTESSLPSEALAAASQPASDQPKPTVFVGGEGSAGGETPKSKKKLIGIIVIAIVVLGLGAASAYFFMPRKDNTQADKATTNSSNTKTDDTSVETTPATTVDPGATTPSPAASTKASTVAMIKDYIASWKSNEAKAKAYLNLTKLKEDPTCFSKCTDEDIYGPERTQYTTDSIKVDDVVADGAKQVKVYVHDTNSPPPQPGDPQKGGYEYTLEADGNSWKIVGKIVFVE